jgi:hypothetical protein
VLIEERFSDLSKIFLKVWSIESSSKWSSQNPANGQCGVTALVVNDLFGGEILKTKTPEGWHYYNKIDGIRCDFLQNLNFLKYLTTKTFLPIERKHSVIPMINSTAN